MPSLPEIVKQHCTTCETETERIINGLVKELEESQADKNHLHELIAEQGMKITEYERNPIIPKYAELQAEYERLKAENDDFKTRPAESKPDIRDQIIDLIAPAIEFKEQFYVNGEYKELVTLYREYRPKEGLILPKQS